MNHLIVFLTVKWLYYKWTIGGYYNYYYYGYCKVLTMWMLTFEIHIQTLFHLFYLSFLILQYGWCMYVHIRKYCVTFTILVSVFILCVIVSFVIYLSKLFLAYK